MILALRPLCNRPLRRNKPNITIWIEIATFYDTLVRGPSQPLPTGVLMSDHDFLRQMQGYGLATVQIHYFMPDHRSLLQQFVIQQYDVAPQFPELTRFLDFWRREIEAVIHSVRVAHKHLIGPQEWRAVDGIISLH
jgi:uncharacterized protein Usg